MQIEETEAQILQRNNNLANAAANYWLDRRSDERLAAIDGAYIGELHGWLKKEYFKRARDGMIGHEPFCPKTGYKLTHVPPIAVPDREIEAWVERRKECRESAAMVKKGARGIKWSMDGQKP